MAPNERTNRKEEPPTIRSIFNRLTSPVRPSSVHRSLASSGWWRRTGTDSYTCRKTLSTRDQIIAAQCVYPAHFRVPVLRSIVSLSLPLPLRSLPGRSVVLRGSLVLHLNSQIEKSSKRKVFRKRPRQREMNIDDQQAAAVLVSLIMRRAPLCGQMNRADWMAEVEPGRWTVGGEGSIISGPCQNQ